ncbi:hypothetical protein CEXT_586371 [Caerostris extrusa]|uniref:Uncharacterized protein n=1 Tax=Caerostris extrusa TaxID=172846 RepID=A0AAV4RFN7_CAEEX|nr:hypothetical protein CEXT_586371 [Caerostris extrusa]
MVNEGLRHSLSVGRWFAKEESAKGDTRSIKGGRSRDVTLRSALQESNESRMTLCGEKYVWTLKQEQRQKEEREGVGFEIVQQGNSEGERVLAVYNRSAGNIHRMHGVLLVKTSPGNRPMINLGGWPSGVGGEAIAIHHPADDGPPVR